MAINFDTSKNDPIKNNQIEKLVKNYKYYQNKLLQITQRNRSVLLRRIYNKHNFDLVDAEYFKTGVIQKIIESSIKNKATSVNILFDSIEDEEADSARAKLRNLSRNMNLIEEETGQQTGYFGFPFLEGHLNSDFYIRGPLVLFPINLERKRQARGGGWFVNLTDNRPLLNGALIAAIKKKGEYNLTEDYEERFDDLIDETISYSGENPEKFFFDKINQWIKTIIPLDELKNKINIQELEPITQEIIYDLPKQSIHLVNYAIIGNFPQAENAIFKDYTSLLEKLHNTDIGILGNLLNIDINDYENEQFYEDESFEEVTDEYRQKLDQISDQELNTVLPSDSSQDEIIIESKKTSFVPVRGPPGTGKSQVIVNLVSDALSNGKKVLVVCQKRAALEVVYHRLASVDLDRYTVFLNKENEDRLKMYKQLNDLIETPTNFELITNKEVEKISNKINQNINFLSTLGLVLRKKYFGGATLSSLYSRADGSYFSILDLAFYNDNIEWNSLPDFLSNLTELEKNYKRFEDKNFPFYGRCSFADYGLNERNQLFKILDELLENFDSCILVNLKELQKELAFWFDEYLNNVGFLQLNRKKATKKITKLLGTEPDLTFISENFSKVENGQKFWNTLESLFKFFNSSSVDYIMEIIKDKNAFASYLTQLKNCLNEFDVIQQYDREKRNSAKIIKILDLCKEKMKYDENWTKNFEQELYFYWIQKIENENPILKGEPFKQYDLQREELHDLIIKKRQIVIKKIQSDIERTINVRDIYQRERTSSGQEWRKLRKELNKKRQVKPVRKLFNEFSSLLLQIAPCWLASPEMVSKIFPLQRELFDLVIIDEASQLAIERSLPVLYRAKNAVIAGDEKQLPPFDLFQIREEELDDVSEDISEEKSLLDLARIQYNTYNLSWHYRSKYQDLINFSNHAFYDGLLNVAPNVQNNPDEPPVKWIECNGVWDNRKNHVEAKRVLEEVYNIWKKHELKSQFPSIGIITFNDSQKDLILDELENRKEDDVDFAILYDSVHKNNNNQLFVKNIENVQGDERDIIIFSIGYAYDYENKFSNNFGMLNLKGGENRLNVAITRARQEMIVICSIQPSDIKETSMNDGPRYFKKFLEYAKAVSKRDKDNIENILSNLNPNMKRDRQNQRLVFDSDFEIQVHSALERAGYHVDTQIGQSGYRIDLAVVNPQDPNRYILAIECDGATFHSAKSVKERDVMRQEFLENKGWVIERIWSRNWWRNPQKEIDRIDAKIKELSNLI